MIIASPWKSTAQPLPATPRAGQSRRFSVESVKTKPSKALQGIASLGGWA